MLYGFMDESGSPGRAISKRDYLVVSLVVFASWDNCERNISKIEKLRKELNLPNTYEFHCSSNSSKPQTGFLKLLKSLDFHFITVAIRKNDFKKTASYTRMADLLFEEIYKKFPKITIEMDSNPVLHAELRKKIKFSMVSSIKIKERRSRSNQLIQVADYIANISARLAKYPTTATGKYAYITKKATSFIVIDK